jgi:hypothetical protein
LIGRGYSYAISEDLQHALQDFEAVVMLKGVPKEQVARALFNRSVAKGMLGDTQGAMADCTAVVTLSGAPKELVARALLNRGVTNLVMTRKAKAISDWTAVLELGNGVKDAVSMAAEKLFRLHWQDGATNEVNTTLDRFAQHLATSPPENRTLKLADFFARLASPDMRQGWTHATRRLLGVQPSEIRQSLGFLKPVCAVLEGGEKSLLDPLPPEQREFALKVLARFDAAKSQPAAHDSIQAVQSIRRGSSHFGAPTA